MLAPAHDLERINLLSNGLHHSALRIARRNENAANAAVLDQLAQSWAQHR
jgi:hypothetical protein